MSASSDAFSAKRLEQDINETKTLFWVLTTVLLATAPAADAQQAGKVARIGYLDDSTTSTIAVRLEAFRQELSKLGWIEGKNIHRRVRVRDSCSSRT